MSNFYTDNPDLAATLRRIAADPKTFYTGAMAVELAASVQQGGGLLTAADLAAYQAKDREPLLGAYRGYDIITAKSSSGFWGYNLIGNQY